MRQSGTAFARSERRKQQKIKYHIPCQNGADMVHFYYHESVKYLYQFRHFAKISEKSERKQGRDAIEGGLLDNE